MIEDARQGKTATLMLDARVEQDTTSFQLAAWLPGKDYGTDSDRAVFMGTHTDGPGLIQDSAAFGILATLEYYSKMRRSDRPMSIFAYFDCRHFTERGEENGIDYVEHNLEELSKVIVGGVAVEHFGGAQMHDVGDAYEPTGNPMTTYIYTFGNDLLVEAAIAAVNSSGLERAQVNVGARGQFSLTRPGVNGGVQNRWRGGHFAEYLDKMGGLPSGHRPAFRRYKEAPSIVMMAMRSSTRSKRQSTSSVR